METQELAGRRLGDRYLLQEPIASGGMATVWRAADEVLGRPVAVKILHEPLARDLDLLERFRLEAVAAARLSHPAVVRVFDTGVDDGVCYIVMELFEGQSLSAFIDDRGPLPSDEAARIVGTALQGLAHAHREGVIHRDVKPSNILVHPAGGVKVTDFGIAKAAFAGGDLTTTGNLLGTARYLAPEQVGGGGVDGRTDLYAMGIVLYQALTGRVPFEAETHLATATMRLTRDPTPPGALRPGIPRAVEAVVLKALARDPDERYQSAEEMSAALEGAAPSPGPARRRPAGRRRPRQREERPEPAAPSFFRSWMLVPLILALLAALVVAGVFVFDDFLAGDGPGGSPAEADATRLEIDAAADYDPEGDDQEENPEAVPLAIDRDESTSWTTEGYGSALLGNLKDGVGIYVDLGSPQEVTGLRVRTRVPGWRFQIRASDEPNRFAGARALPSDDGRRVFQTRPTTRITLEEPVTNQYVLVWIVLLADAGGDYRGDVAEIAVLGPGG